MRHGTERYAIRERATSGYPALRSHACLIYRELRQFKVHRRSGLRRTDQQLIRRPFPAGRHQIPLGRAPIDAMFSDEYVELELAEIASLVGETKPAWFAGRAGCKKCSAV
jgi:hypothetical protein